MSAPRWRLAVDPDRCIGSGMCAAIAPYHFRVDGPTSPPLAEVVDLDDAVTDAVDSCPTEAISVREAPTGS